MRKNERYFSQSEQYRILELVEANLHIVENKKTDGATCQRKEKAWQAIFEQYEASNTGRQRTIYQIQNEWKNLKQTTKFLYSLLPTGVEPPPSEIDEIQQKVHRLITYQSQSSYDSFDSDSAPDKGANECEEAAGDSPPTEPFDINPDDWTAFLGTGVEPTASKINESAACDANEDIATVVTPIGTTTIAEKKSGAHKSSIKSDDCIVDMAKKEHNLNVKYVEMKMEVKRRKLELVKRKLEMAEELHAAKMKKLTSS